MTEATDLGQSRAQEQPRIYRQNRPRDQGRPRDRPVRWRQKNQPGLTRELRKLGQQQEAPRALGRRQDAVKATMKRIKKRHHTRLLTSGGRTWDRVRAISVSENVRGATGRLLGSASPEPLAVLSVELEDTSPKRGGVGRACVSGTNAVRACKHARPFQLASIHGAGDEWVHTIPAP